MPSKSVTAPSVCLSSHLPVISQGFGEQKPCLWGAGRCWVTSSFWEDTGQSYTEMGCCRALLLKKTSWLEMLCWVPAGARWLLLGNLVALSEG